MISRRNLIQAATAFGIIGLARKSGADPAPRAKRVLIFNASGGIRNTAAISASSQVRFNPWGVLGKSGVLTLGNILVSSPNVVSYDARSPRPRRSRSRT